MQSDRPGAKPPFPSDPRGPAPHGPAPDSPATPARWGLVSTIKAPIGDILAFAAWHIELGAHRLFLYLDDPDTPAHALLDAHPRIIVRKCNAAYWQKRGGRPATVEARQSANARHAYRRKLKIDWLGHIDVDEFIAPLDGAPPVATALAALAPDCLSARLPVVEYLAPMPGTPGPSPWFKAFSPNRARRQTQTEAIYPQYGYYLNGGFISHVIGKVFFRTLQPGLEIRIHNVFVNGVENPGHQRLNGYELCHFHYKDFDDWRAHFQFRHALGSYKDALKPNIDLQKGGLNTHQLFEVILESEGEQGLRAFFDDVCTATAQLRARLADHGLLRRHHLAIEAARERVFPDWRPNQSP